MIKFIAMTLGLVFVATLASVIIQGLWMLLTIAMTVIFSSDYFITHAFTGFAIFVCLAGWMVKMFIDEQND